MIRALLLLLVPACLVPAQVVSAHPSGLPDPSIEAYGRPQQLVDIGGRRLNLYCLGKGSPTVILETGLGGSTITWRKVQAELARTTRVCAYDRAGYGFSDPGPLPRDTRHLSDDLAALTEAAALEQKQRHPRTAVIHQFDAVLGAVKSHPKDQQDEFCILR